MTDTPSPRRSRSRVAERAQHLYTARTDEYTTGQTAQTSFRMDFAPNEYAAPQTAYLPNESEKAAAGFTPNEPGDDHSAYQPNEQATLYSGYTPNEQTSLYSGYTPNEQTSLYSGYTPNEEPAAYEPAAQPYGFEVQPAQEETLFENVGYTASNVYRPREVTWAEEDREEAIAESELGYQVQQDEPEEQLEKGKRHTLRNVLIVLLAVCLLGGGAWLMREPLANMFGITVFVSQPTAEPFTAVVTPEPVKAYDAAPAAAVADAARIAIARLSGTLEMENYIVTDQHIVTRNQRPDGTYDFYLFTAAEGRLLCYFEGLEALDMIPQAFGGFYVEQAPWLVAPGGSALVRTADIEAALNENVFLHPMYGGWAVVESLEDGHSNYVNASGQVLSSLWFSRTFPFTGIHTLAYVDTGSTADADDRYLLYVIGEDGSMSRWLAAADMQDVVGAACGMAYMSDGSLYQLPETSAPVCQSSDVTVYLDCDALVIRSPETGKYGLFVHGEQHYDFAYDAIYPLESDITWAEKKLGAGEALMTVKAVEGAAYPQPLSHSFVLEKDGQMEYVALSTQSSYPIRLDGEF